MEKRKYKGSIPIFMRHIEIHHIQELLMARGRKYDWMIIHILAEQTNTKFNNGNTNVSAKEKCIFLNYREIRHIEHLLFTNKSEYNMKILNMLGENSFPYIPERGMFQDY